jgi:hypothetical protein
LKDKAFLTFLGQKQPFELRPKTGVSPANSSWNPSWLIQKFGQPFKFLAAWRDFEERFEKTLAGIRLTNILRGLGDIESELTLEADLQWENADHDGL